MKEEVFIAGQYKQQREYKSFSPSRINKDFTLRSAEIHVLLEKANLYLGELNAFSHMVPDIDYFIKMHIAKEANTSSRIEGTQTTFDELFLPKAEIISERKDDYNEVHNYIKAINLADGELSNIPLSVRLLKETHKILMTGARGKNKNPGELRKSQNWIGGSSLKDAYYIPPSHEEVPDLLSDLEKFWHNEQLQIPHLIKIALSHYQFETIHPFLDGNGRIGRLLITLYLMHFGLLDKPSLYLSDFFERNKSSYYDALSLVRTSNNIEHWLKFFLVGVSETAKKGKGTLQNIVDLRQKYEEIIETNISLKRRKLARTLLLQLYSQPTMTVDQLASLLEVTFQTANVLASEFEHAGLLREKTGMSRNRIFELGEYIDIFVDLNK